MDRTTFHKLFKSPGPVVLPVIHVLDNAQAERNVRVAIGEGAAGVFLINHDFGIEPFLPIVRLVRAKFPALWLGLNFLAVTGAAAFPLLAGLGRDGCPVDGYWADDARIDETREPGNQREAQTILDIKARDRWDGLYTGGTMDGAIRLVERQGGKVIALAAVAIEDNATTAGNRQNYRCVSGVMPGSHWQSECNAQKLSSFATYQPEQAFPRIR